MSKLVFVSDFFVNEVKGGAEIVDDHLTNLLSKKQISVTKIKSQNLTEIDKDELFDIIQSGGE